MSESTSTAEAVGEIVSDVLQVDQTDLPGAIFGEDIPAESLDYIEIAEMIDFELGVAIPDEALEDIDTVDDLVAYVEDQE